MAVSKVILNGTTLIDVTEDTVASGNLLSGNTATGADGEKVQGSYVPSVPNLQAKSAIPSESNQTILPDSGYDGLTQVAIAGIDSNYVGSQIPRKSSADLSVSGRTVTAPIGYYSSAATKSIPLGTASTPVTDITATPNISINASGLITATVSAEMAVTPAVSAGYISAGTAGNINVSGSNTSQLTTQGASTYTPTTTDQTIASGKYLTGAQTIKGDANLVPANIASGVSIFGINGTHEGGGSGSGIENKLITRTLSGEYSNSVLSNIGTYAFASCAGLTSINMLNVSSIGYGAFYKCTSLSNIILRNDSINIIPAYTFAGTRISSISFPNVQTIDDAAFSSCTLLTSMSLSKLQNIGQGAFYRCSNISIVDIPSCTNIYPQAFYSVSRLHTINAPKCTSIGSSAFGYAFRQSVSNSLSFPLVRNIFEQAFFFAGSDNSPLVLNFPSLTSIYPKAFYYASISTFSAPMLSYIDSYAFYSCKFYGQEDIEFTASKIGSYAFANLYGIKSAAFPNLTQVDQYAFYCAKTLEHIELSSVVYIYEYAFESCSVLTTVNAPLTSYIDAYAFMKCSSLSTISFPVLATVNAAAFSQCTKLSEIYCPNITTIGSYAFTACAMSSFKASSSVKTIGDCAFSGCQNLKAAIFNANSTATIGSGVFNRCFNLISLYLLGNNMVMLSANAENVFSSTPIMGYTSSAGQVGSIYVRSTVYNQYINANYWRVISSRIVSITNAEASNILNS